MKLMEVGKITKILRTEIRNLKQENTTLRHHRTNLKEKLDKCLEFFQGIADQSDTDFLQRDKIIAQLAKENEYLKTALEHSITLPSSNVGESDHEMRHRRKTRTKSIDSIETDSEGDSSSTTDIAVKLLMIKYNFERRMQKRNQKPQLQKDNKSESEVSSSTMQDKIKEYGNLKPKQQFIMMQNTDEESGNGQSVECKENGETVASESKKDSSDLASGESPKKGEADDDDDNEDEAEILKKQQRLSSYSFL